MSPGLLREGSGFFDRIRRSVDWVVVVLSLAIVTLAMVNLNSAGAGDWSGRTGTQLRWIGLGTVVMVITTALDYRLIYRLAYILYAVGVGLLALVPYFGIKVNNARRWLGTMDYRIQPSEIMKVLLIVALARFVHDFSGREHKSWWQLAIPFSMVLVPVALIVQQPDLGTGVMLLIIAVSLMALTGLRWRSVLVVASAGVLSLAFGWGYMAEYQRKRIDVWLNPEVYADNEGYQTSQAMISVGNGGFFGRGVEKGSQTTLGFLPEPFTDFPFAVYAEEWGFIGGVILLMLYMCITLWALNIASQARDRFSALLCAGVASLLFWHVAINIGMVLQLVPVSGITLPFFSFGGSNIITVMIGLGLLMSVSRSRHLRA